jgi:integrase
MKLERYYDKRRQAHCWRFDFTLGGVRYRDGGFATKTLAERAVATLRLRATEARYGLEETGGEVTVAELVAERGRAFNPKLARHRRARKVLEGFAADLPAGCRVRDITAADLRRWVRLRYQANPKLMPNSLNRELAEISALLKAAPELFHALEGYQPPKMPWVKTSHRTRSRPITESEEEALLTALRAPAAKWESPRCHANRLLVADLFELSLLTGMRNGETVALRWGQVDLQASEARLRETKTGESRVVPLSSRARELLSLRRAGAANSRFVFPNSRGDKPFGQYLRVFRRVAERSGLNYGMRSPDGFTLHATRHTAATRMLRAGADVATVQEIVGHSDRTMTLLYSHASAESRKRAVEALVRGESRQKVVKKITD